MMENNKNRLFEVMKKLNPNFINEIDDPNVEHRLKTFGDLKRAINLIRLKSGGGKLAGVATSVLLSVLTMGLGNAAQTGLSASYDLFKAFYHKPDNIKTNT